MSKFIIAVLFAISIASAIGVIHAKHQSRKLFAEMQSLERMRDKLIIEYSQLQLEEGTWATHGRIEKLAREELGMHVPLYESIKFIDFRTAGSSNE